MQIVLASSSIYRKSLLQRLGLQFEVANPNIDERQRENETPRELAARLALEKAHKIAEQLPNALIIGSDQVAVLDGQILNKPGTIENAEQQLQAASGNSVEFLTGLCLYNSTDASHQLDVISYKVLFRELTHAQISEYVRRDQPLNCAGSFKWEKLGIALFKSMQGGDVTALEGLPLIRLTEMLNQAGISVI